MLQSSFYILLGSFWKNIVAGSETEQLMYTVQIPWQGVLIRSESMYQCK
jgi:hypothetical protein